MLSIFVINFFYHYNTETMAASPAEAGVVIAGPMLMECNPVHILDFPAVNTNTKSRLTLTGTLGKLRTWTGT
jgi:hypothetical protein